MSHTSNIAIRGLLTWIRRLVKEVLRGLGDYESMYDLGRYFYSIVEIHSALVSLRIAKDSHLTLRL